MEDSLISEITIQNNKPIHALDFHPKGNLLAIGGDRIIFIWDILNKKEKLLIDVEEDVNAISYTNDGNMIAVALKKSKQVKLYNANSGNHIKTLFD